MSVRSIPLQECLSKVVVLCEVLAQGSQSASFLYHTLAEQAGHARHTVYAIEVSIEVHLGMLCPKVHLHTAKYSHDKG